MNKNEQIKKKLYKLAAPRCVICDDTMRIDIELSEKLQSSIGYNCDNCLNLAMRYLDKDKKVQTV